MDEQEQKTKEPNSEGPLKEGINSYEERLKLAKVFLESLKIKPDFAALFGSTAERCFKPKSDIDVVGIYSHDKDIPFAELSAREDPESGLIDGMIDFQYFAADWAVFTNKPGFLKEFIERYQKTGVVLKSNLPEE